MSTICISDNNGDNFLNKDDSEQLDEQRSLLDSNDSNNNNNNNIIVESKDEEEEGEGFSQQEDSETDGGDFADDDSDGSSIDGEGGSETDDDPKEEKKIYSQSFLLGFRQQHSDMPDSMVENRDKISAILKTANNSFQAISNSYNNNSNHKKNNKKKGGRNNYNNKNNNNNNYSAPNTPRKINSHNPNAWQIPARNLDSEEGKRTEFNRKINGFLNKLTLENFDSLTLKFLSSIIEHKEYLDDVINSIFDKALGEPKFSMVYSKLCHSMYKNLDVNNSNVNEPDINFRKLLVNKCQEQFNNKITDQEFENEELYSKIKQRYLGNIKFIGELFLANLLPTEVITLSSTSLIQGRDSNGAEEEDLEALCKLLTTTGKIFEQKAKGVQLEKFESIFNALSHARDLPDVSSRIKYMILDLQDLRKDNWVPRRKFEGPMKIADVHKEAKKAEEKTNSNNRLNKSSSNLPPPRSLNQSGDSYDNRRRDNNNNNNYNDNKGGRGKQQQQQQGHSSPQKPNLSWKMKSDSAINNNVVLIEEKPKVEEVPVKPKQSFTSSFNTIVEEYYNSYDEIDSKESLSDLNAADSLHEFVFCLINKTTKKDRIPPSVKLIRFLIDENLLTKESVEKGFELIFENLEETLEDFPNATSFYGEIFGNLFNIQIISFSFIQTILSNDEISMAEKTKIVINFLKAALSSSTAADLAAKIREANFDILSHALEVKLNNEADLQEVVSLLKGN